MPVTLLKSAPQSLWLADHEKDSNDPNDEDRSLGYSSDGICYYLSEYVRLNTWDKAKIKTIEAAIKAAQDVRPVTIVNAGKAKNMKAKGGDVIPQVPYNDNPPMELKPKSVYRVGMWAGASKDVPVNPKKQNHEALVFTGSNSDVVFYEPNFGFYKADMNNQPNKTRKVVLETAIKNLYSGLGWVAVNFHYLKDHSF